MSFLFGFGTCAYAEFFDNSTIALEKRIAPVGKVKVVASNIAQPSLNEVNKDTSILLGKTIFESKCILCHKNGVAGAPRLGNKQDWTPRIKKKIFTLIKTRNYGLPGNASQRGMFRMLNFGFRISYSLYVKTASS